MNSKKYKRTIALIVVLMLLAGGLFVYTNFFASKEETAAKVGIYVAKEDIRTGTLLTKDMFVYVGISKDSLLPSFVTDFKEVEGKQLIGTLLMHEPLTIVRISKDSTSKHLDFALKVEPDSLGDIKPEDMVRVYVQYTDRRNMTSEVKVLFDVKRVGKITSSDNTILSTNNGSGGVCLYFEATEQEIKDYYIAKAIGKIIVVEYNAVDLNDFSSEDGKGVVFTEKIPAISKEDKFDPKSESVQGASSDAGKNTSGLSVMTYTVQVSDSLESISIKFKTDVTKLSELNNGRTVFVVGETITVPSN